MQLINAGTLPGTSAGWISIAASIAGAKRRASATGNQDFAAWAAAPDQQHPWAVIAVSDGHGSEPHFRSHVGARFAVEEAIAGLSAFVASTGESADAGELAGSIESRWKRRVSDHVLAHPFCEEEAALLEGRSGAGDPAGQLEWIAYGATCLAAAVSPDFAVYLQLGDGDIVTVWERDGSRVAEVFERSPELAGDATFSLCQPGAARRSRVEVVRFAPSRPALIMLATDGVSNSFRDDEAFVKFPLDVLDRLRQPNGPEAVQKALPGWLDRVSEFGCGDDVSVAMLYSNLEEGCFAPR